MGDSYDVQIGLREAVEAEEGGDNEGARKRRRVVRLSEEVEMRGEATLEADGTSPRETMIDSGPGSQRGEWAGMEGEGKGDGEQDKDDDEEDEDHVDENSDGGDERASHASNLDSRGTDSAEDGQLVRQIQDSLAGVEEVKVGGSEELPPEQVLYVMKRHTEHLRSHKSEPGESLLSQWCTTAHTQHPESSPITTKQYKGKITNTHQRILRILRHSKREKRVRQKLRDRRLDVYWESQDAETHIYGRYRRPCVCKRMCQIYGGTILQLYAAKTVATNRTRRRARRRDHSQTRQQGVVAAEGEGGGEDVDTRRFNELADQLKLRLEARFEDLREYVDIRMSEMEEKLDEVLSCVKMERATKSEVVGR